MTKLTHKTVLLVVTHIIHIIPEKCQYINLLFQGNGHDHTNYFCVFKTETTASHNTIGSGFTDQTRRRRRRVTLKSSSPTRHYRHNRRLQALWVDWRSSVAGPSLAVSRPLGSRRRVSLALYIYTRTVLYIYIYIYVMSVYILFLFCFSNLGFLLVYTQQHRWPANCNDGTFSSITSDMCDLFLLLFTKKKFRMKRQAPCCTALQSVSCWRPVVHTSFEKADIDFQQDPSLLTGLGWWQILSEFLLGGESRQF